MATEAAVDKAADVPATESQLAPDSQNAELDPSAVNGSADELENKHITSVEDQVNSTDVSTSGGSDTEASRADGSKNKDDDKGHTRTGSSVKKPATFKAVSVNRTFLAAKATTSVSSSKVAENPPAGSSTPPTSSATLSASRPRLVAKSGSGVRDSSPRLSGANGAKPGSAPDASAVWNKNRPLPAPEPKKFTDEELKKYGIHMASRLNEDDTQGQNKWADIDDDDDDWAPEAITWGDGTKTTLPHPDEHPPPGSDNGSVASKTKELEKPRSPAPPPLTGSPLPKPSGLASGKGLILKSGSQEKPTLVAKPPAPPTPVKSPWATLPPVERASPGASEPAQLARGSMKDPSPLKVMAPPREIAADDFSRSSLRDGQSYGGRELYNSQSGRYEPAPVRRGSMRMEQHPKHPSLLQRPSPSDFPAEPSGSFQTNRVTQAPPYGRRRGSSNVSGGSGSFMQQAVRGNDSSVPPPEFPSARRTSFAGSVESPVSPGNVSLSSQGLARQHPQPGFVPRASPRDTFAHAGPPAEPLAGPPPPMPPVVDDVEYQKKLMKESGQLARKRRQEEEAREEAARKERIQKKLEALGPPPEKKSDKKEDVPDQSEGSQPTQIQKRESIGSPESSTSTPQDPTAKSTPPKGEKPMSEAKAAPVSGPPPAGPPTSRRVSQSQEPKPVDLWGSASSSRQERLASSSWAPGSQASLRNVWGAPNNDRGLGNGTFNTDLGRIPPKISPSSQSANGPPPIAPPNSAMAPSQGRPQPPAPIGSRLSRYGAPGSDLASKWVAAVGDNDRKMSAARLAERTEQERQLADHGLTMEDAQPVIKETWRPVHAPGDGTRRPAGAPETQPAVQPGPWRAPGDEIAKNASRGELRSAGSASVIGSGGPILPQPKNSANAQGRASSRFFPMRDARTENATSEDAPRSKSPTPPPPTMEGHPAYEGDAMRPQVTLPRPQPVVKLPPSMAGSQAPNTRQQHGWASSSTFKDARAPISPPRAALTPGEATQEKWQNRINSLLNGGRSPPQRSMGVDPSSRSTLDHTIHHDTATVSLPVVPPTQRAAVFGSCNTKPMAEECFEEQEMGSLPQIRLPHKAPEAAWQPALAQTKPLPKKFLVQPAIMEPYYFAAEVVGGGNAIKISFPGMSEPKIVTIPFSAARGGRGSQSRSGPRHRGAGSERRGGRRDGSRSRDDHRSTPPSRAGRSSNYRSRGSEAWGRSSAAPPSLPA